MTQGTRLRSYTVRSKQWMIEPNDLIENFSDKMKTVFTKKINVLPPSRPVPSQLKDTETREKTSDGAHKGEDLATLNADDDGDGFDFLRGS